MSRFKNPIPDILEASEAAARIISLQADLFMLNQELKTLRQLKKTLWIGGSVMLMNVLLTLSFFWLGEGLHEAGWSPYVLAVTCAVFFGLFIGIFLTLALKRDE